MQLPSRIQRENAKGGQQLNTRGLVFEVLHLSGYGVGRGSDADRAAQQQRQPSGSDARFEQELDSETELRNPAEVVQTHVHATVPIGLRFISAPGDQIPGQAPINYLSCQWTLTDRTCSATVTTQGSNFPRHRLQHRSESAVYR